MMDQSVDIPPLPIELENKKRQLLNKSERLINGDWTDSLDQCHIYQKSDGDYDEELLINLLSILLENISITI